MGWIRHITMAAVVAVAALHGPAPALAAPGPVPTTPLASDAIWRAGWVCLPVGCWWRPQPMPNWLPRTGCAPCYVRGRPVWSGATSYWWFPPPDWVEW